MKVEVDDKSGFCYGVICAIEQAEQMLQQQDDLFSLGEIVHNGVEMERLSKKGLKVLRPEQLSLLHDKKVLIRAHGEPPNTYEIARENNLIIIDCTCPVVLRLQQRIKEKYVDLKQHNGQLVIFGKPMHAEVNGLIGQVGGDALVLENEDQVDIIDFSRPVCVFAQTTKDTGEFEHLCQIIRQRMQQTFQIENPPFEACNTICQQVSSRRPHLVEFSQKHDVIIFVSGTQSSNGKVLYEACKSSNPSTHMVERLDELKGEWFLTAETVGVCGATSTPKWLMEEIAKAIICIKG